MSGLNAVEVPVEVLELTPRWLAGGLAAGFARIQILVSYYHGDPLLWLRAIERGQTPGDEADVQFLRKIQQRILLEPEFLNDMRRIVNEFATRAAGIIT